MTSRVARHLLVWIALLTLPGLDILAQPTMLQWEDDLLVMVRGRHGSIGGLLYDRGVQRRYAPGMDHEYDLDIRSARFSREEDAQFFSAGSGIRTFTASIDKSHFATTTDVRHRLQLGDRHEVFFRGRQQEDRRAQRFLVEGGYAFEVLDHQYIGFTQTMASFKPDLDTELYYETRNPLIGQLRAGIVLLDAFNNTIIDGLGVDPALQDTLRSYSRSPRLMRVRWLSPQLGRMSMEAFVGLQPRSTATFTTHSDPDFYLDQSERFGYGLIHAVYDVGWLQAGIYIAAWRERLSFSADSSSTASRDYAIDQRETRYGARFRWLKPVSEHHSIEMVIDAAVLRYRDHQTGRDFSGASVPEAFHLHEDRLEIEARVGWKPRETGLRATLRWLSDHRRYDEGIDVLERHFLRFAQWTPNSRLSLLLGYDFLPTFRLEVGASFDVDGDGFYTDGRGLTRFDGGFGRVHLTW